MLLHCMLQGDQEGMFVLQTKKAADAEMREVLDHWTLAKPQKSKEMNGG